MAADKRGEGEASDGRGGGALNEHDLVQQLRTGELLAPDAAAALNELVRDVERGRGASGSARREVAERLGVSRDVLDDRLSINAKLEADTEIANRLAALAPALQTPRSGPRSSGLAIYRYILRIEPRDLRQAVLDELQSATELTYRKVVQTTERLREKTRGAVDRPFPDEVIPFSVAAPHLVAALRSLGVSMSEPQGAGLPAKEWRKLLAKDRRDVPQHRGSGFLGG
jgi:hypothetical protein